MRPDGTTPDDEDMDALMAGTFDFSGFTHLARVGKKAAGRLLDGVEHNARPVVQR